MSIIFSIFCSAVLASFIFLNPIQIDNTNIYFLVIGIVFLGSIINVLNSIYFFEDRIFLRFINLTFIPASLLILILSSQFSLGFYFHIYLLAIVLFLINTKNINSLVYEFKKLKDYIRFIPNAIGMLIIINSDRLMLKALSSDYEAGIYGITSQATNILIFMT